MEQMIRSTLQQYKAYAAEAKFEAKWQTAFPNEQMQEKQLILEMRLAALNCWLGLLNPMERFVIGRHLIDGIEWTELRREFQEKWSGPCRCSKRSLEKIEDNALRRIETFSRTRMDVIARLWGDLPY